VAQSILTLLLLAHKLINNSNSSPKANIRNLNLLPFRVSNNLKMMIITRDSISIPLQFSHLKLKFQATLTLNTPQLESLNQDSQLRITTLMGQMLLPMAKEISLPLTLMQELTMTIFTVDQLKRKSL